MVSHSTMILLLFVGFCLCLDSSNAYKFNVGGRDGWVLHPSEDYSHWSHRLRFSVNDTLYFAYKKGEDSVLQVTGSDFYKCNTTNPIMKMEDGSSEFKLARSGPFFFISGVKENCEKGQRFHVVVLSEHHHRSPAAHPPSISPSPSPSTLIAHPPAKSPSHSPLASPPTASPSPQSAPIHHPPAPAPSPKVSPTLAPASPSPRVSPAPASPSPRVSPAPASPSPSVTPAPASPSPSVTPAPSSPSPSVSPAPSPSVSPAPSPSVSPAPASPSPSVSLAPSPSVSPAPASPSPTVSPAPIALPPMSDDEVSPAPAPSKNSAAKILMGLPVAVALMACSIGLI